MGRVVVTPRALLYFPFPFFFLFYLSRILVIIGGGCSAGRTPVHKVSNGRWWGDFSHDERVYWCVRDLEQFNMLLVYLHGISGAQNCVDEGGELVYDDWCDGPVTVQNVATDRMTSFISRLEKRSWGIALLGIFPCPSPCNIVHKRKKK